MNFFITITFVTIHFQDSKSTVCRFVMDAIFKLATSSGKRNVTVWRPSVRLSVPFSDLNRTRGTYST